MITTDQPFTRLEWGAIAVVLLAWSVNYLAVRLGVNEFPVWIALSIRFSIIAVVLAPFYRITKAQIKPIFWVMLALAPGHFAFLFYALQMTDSVGTISIIIQLAPAFSVLLAWAFLNDIPGLRRVVGLAIAFFGVVVLFYDPSFFDNWPALAVALVGAFFLGLYPLLLKQAGGIHPLAIITWSSIFALPITLGMALYNNEWEGLVLADVSQAAWLGIAYSAIGSSILAHGTWAWLVQRQSISKLAPLMLVVPILVVILSALFFAEAITLRFMIATAIVIIGIYMITQSKAYKS